MPEDKRAGMQRVRVGLTGLGAVLLIVAVSAAIFQSAHREPATAAPPPTRSEQTVANMVGNTAEAPSDPLSEMGVTPAAPATGNAATPAPSK